MNPSTKVEAVSNLITNGTQWNRVLIEIEKCVILCANCHRRVHLAGMQIPQQI